MKIILTIKEYALLSLLWIFVAFFWYKNLLYINIVDFDDRISYAILGGIIFLVFAINLLPVFISDIDNKTVWATTVLPYGIYTFIAYSEYMKTMYIWIVSIGLVTAIAYMVLLWGRRIPLGKDAKKVIKVRKKRTAVGIRNILAYACTAILICSFVKASVVGIQPKQLYGDEYMFANNVEVLSKLQQDEWKKCDTGTKLEILQAVINCEGRYLSFNKPIFLHIAELKKGTIACYVAGEKRIYISGEFLNSLTAAEVLSSILHECMHVAQLQYGDIYEKLSVSNKNSYYMIDAKNYVLERKNYIDGNEDFEGYYSQRLEAEARAYGITQAHLYLKKIDEYKNQ